MLCQCCWKLLGATRVFVGLSLCRASTSTDPVCCVPKVGGLRCGYGVCQAMLCPVPAHAVAEMHAGPVVWGLGDALMGVLSH